MIWTCAARILLIRRKALGDALVTMPAVLEWPRLARGASSTWSSTVRSRRSSRDSATGAGAGLAAAWSRCAGCAACAPGRYDLVIDWLGSPRTAALDGPDRGAAGGWDTICRGARWAYNVRVPRNRTGGRDLRGSPARAFLDPLRAPGPGAGSLAGRFRRRRLCRGRRPRRRLSGLGARHWRRARPPWSS